MRSILPLPSALIVTMLLATAAGGRIAAASPDDCSISGMGGSLACPLSTWTSPPSPGTPQEHTASSTQGCTAHYQLYSSHVKWVKDCPAISELPRTPLQPVPAPAQ